MKNKIAVHALNEALRRDPVLQAQEAGAACDRLLDAGEWSDAASDWQQQAICDGIIVRVAERFGLDPERLALAHRAWNEETSYQQQRHN